MPHPWEQVPLDAYEDHMRLPGIGQLQALEQLTQKRLAQYPARTLGIWGVAGGNGLNCIDPMEIGQVYGVDVNADYLAKCRERYARLGEKLTLVQADLTRPAVLPHAELIIADLIIEYIGVAAFARRVRECAPQRVCCVIQVNVSEAFVSPSPYATQLAIIGALHTDVEERALTSALADIGYALHLREEIPLDNGKLFVRLDYARG